MQYRLALALVCILASLACRSQTADTSASGDSGRWQFVPDLPITRPPHSTVHAGFKERIEQRYVFVECRGSYADTGRALPELFRDMRAAGIEPAGPPFALFFDDPARASSESLRSRACIPSDAAPTSANGLQFDVLPSVTVAYAVVSGAYPDAPRAYPGLNAYVAKMGWVQNGPTREVYLVSPDSVEDFDDLLCEIQIPVGNAR